MHRRQQRTFSDLYSGAVSKMHRRWQQRIAFLVIFKPEIAGSREKLPGDLHSGVPPKVPTSWKKRAFSCLEGSAHSALKWGCRPLVISSL